MREIPQISVLYGGPIVHVAPASGASQTPAFFALAADGQKLFVKHDAHGRGMLEAEADGLKSLANSCALRVPRVFAVNAQWLLMEALERESAGPDFWKALAEGLVALHRHVGSWGYARDNFIGRSPQLNCGFHGNWATFFWEKRLLPQIAQLRSQEIWTRSEDRLLTLLRDRVYSALEPVTEPPSLLHGDLWSGNILCGVNQEAILIDPAVYYGHRETDLAMTELFGGFARRFHQRYTELWPLAEGYPRRRMIYNYYHKLNHASLYGSGYIWDVKKTLRDIVEDRPLGGSHHVGSFET